MGADPGAGKEAENRCFQVIFPTGFNLKTSPTHSINSVLENPDHFQTFFSGEVAMYGQEGRGGRGIIVLRLVLFQKSNLGGGNIWNFTPPEVESMTVEIIGEGVAGQQAKGNIPLIIHTVLRVDFGSDLRRGGSSLNDMDQFSSGGIGSDEVEAGQTCSFNGQTQASIVHQNAILQDEMTGYAFPPALDKFAG